MQSQRFFQEYKEEDEQFETVEMKKKSRGSPEENALYALDWAFKNLVANMNPEFATMSPNEAVTESKKILAEGLIYFNYFNKSRAQMLLARTQMLLALMLAFYKNLQELPMDTKLPLFQLITGYEHNDVCAGETMVHIVTPLSIYLEKIRVELEESKTVVEDRPVKEIDMEKIPKFIEMNSVDEIKYKPTEKTTTSSFVDSIYIQNFEEMCKGSKIDSGNAQKYINLVKNCISFLSDSLGKNNLGMSFNPEYKEIIPFLQTCVDKFKEQAEEIEKDLKSLFQPSFRP